MSATRCYLDFNATAPLREGARQAVLAAMAIDGNASSVHREGRAARATVEGARAEIAAAFGVGRDQVAFTSGGTEAANMLLTPGLRRAAGVAPRRLLVAATEHAAVLHGHRYPAEQVTVLGVDRDGIVDLGALRAALRADGGSPCVLALQAANNETGVLQPVRPAADLVHEAGGLVVCDAVQMVGRLPFRLAESGADAAFVSAHKVGGPKGVGAVAFGTGVLADAFVRGGGQERGLRSGTENVAGIAGFGAAVAEAMAADDAPRLQALRDRLEAGLAAIPDLVVFGAGAPRLPNTSCFAVPGATAETLLMALDLAGIAVSSGSACSSGKVARSHVLAAMGVPGHLSEAALRVSLGWRTRDADIDTFLAAFEAHVRRLHRRPVPAAA